MPIMSLDHVNICTEDVDGTVRFYEQFLGLRNGERPNFSFPGAWMYCGDVPIVHLVGRKPDAPGTGVVDHFAVGAEDIRGYVERARTQGYDYEVRDVPGGRIRQMFVRDPNGVKVELNFLAAADREIDLQEMAPA